ncbi:MAG TPA: hypothetical protein VN673_06790 [Clostridia bacterium]|nr:hypothetical protein [Clostridia bacterium]
MDWRAARARAEIDPNSDSQNLRSGWAATHRTPKRCYVLPIVPQMQQAVLEKPENPEKEKMKASLCPLFSGLCGAKQLRRIGYVSVFTFSLILLHVGCASRPHPPASGESQRSNAEMYLCVNVLRDIDVGNLESARRRLNEECMYRVFCILEEINFRTNKDVLLQQPGLRAAARYWGNRPLPTDSEILSQSTVVSNQIRDALTIVGKDLDARKRTD